MLPLPVPFGLSALRSAWWRAAPASTRARRPL